MKHVKLDAQDELVKRFVMGLAVDAGGSVLELNGKAVACVVPPPQPIRNGKAADDWNDEKSNRRSDLIDREIDGVITPAEAAELCQLDEEMLRYQRRVAPWPIETARKLHQKLLKKAAKARRGTDA